MMHMQLLLIAFVAVVPIICVPTWMQSPELLDHQFEKQSDLKNPLKLTITKNGLLTSKPIVGLCDDVKQYAG